MRSHKYKAYSVLISSTIAFTACFTIWLMFSVIGPSIQKQLGLTETQFGIMAAMPILSGSLIRIPLGVWTDKFGGRIVMAVLMLICVPPIWMMSYATEYWQFLAIGFCMGIVGGSFSVGTPYVAHWFPPQQKGMAMGVFGAGNSGTAVNKFIAPVLIAMSGWALVAQVYAIALAIVVVLFICFSYTDKSHIVANKTDATKGFYQAAKSAAVWKYSYYYFLVFGGYVGFSLWIVHLYQREFSLSLGAAALLGACFSLPGGVLRAVGGWLSDKYGAFKVTAAVFFFSAIFLLLLSIPNLLGIELFTVCVFGLGIAWAFGKASVFKYISDDFNENIGAVSGIVGLFGGLGGFIFPIIFGKVLDMTNNNNSCFVVLLICLIGCFIWMYFSEYKTNQYKKYIIE